MGRRRTASGRAAHGHFVEALAQRAVENIDGAIDLVGRDGERRGDAPDRAALGPAADIHAQSVFEALGGRECA